jgi:predicted NAD/FAD-binding protein
MRAFAGGYYTRLKALYDYIGVKYRTQPFLFTFSRFTSDRNGLPNSSSTPYFIHCSNNHQIPPPRPIDMPALQWLLEILYLLFFYTYFTLCCIFIRPHSKKGGETLHQYLQRIRMPRYFTTYYVLPLISGVTTCPHAVLLEFPACDVIEYKRRTTWEQHYRLANGVGDVQEKLAEGLDTKFLAHVFAIEPQTSRKVKIHWRHSDDTHCLAPLTEEFDEVVLAIAPNIVGDMFEPLRAVMARIPTVEVESIVHRDHSTIRNHRTSPEESSGAAQLIYLQTNLDLGLTESIHVQPSGAIVTTCPFTPINRKHFIKDPSVFTRVLRTPESRQIVNDIFNNDEYDRAGPRSRALSEKSTHRWRNGDNGVSLAGGWCWDGMVLLEGCVVSAVRVAEQLDVDVPF